MRTMPCMDLMCFGSKGSTIVPYLFTAIVAPIAMAIEVSQLFSTELVAAYEDYYYDIIQSSCRASYPLLELDDPTGLDGLTILLFMLFVFAASVVMGYIPGQRSPLSKDGIMVKTYAIERIHFFSDCTYVRESVEMQHGTHDTLRRAKQLRC